MDTVALNLGGYVTVPAWRADIGVIPVKAKMSVPSLSVQDAPASILTDGTIRARLPRAAAATAGTYQAEWTLMVPIVGQVLLEDDEPLYETFETVSSFMVTDDPVLLAPDRDWTDACGLPTPTYIRQKQLFGLPLIDGNNRLYQDEQLQKAIDAAIAQIEKRLDTIICPRVYSSIPGFALPAPEAGEPARLVHDENGYNYDPGRMRSTFGLLRLRHAPVKQILGLSLYMGSQKVTDVPLSWVKVTRSSGDIQVLPDMLNTLMLSIGGMAFPMIANHHGGMSIPQLWRVAYEAGQPVDGAIFDLVSWVAARQTLIIISDSVTAGLASLSTSIDGVSESISTTNSSTNSTYGANIGELTKRIDEWFKDNEDAYRRIQIAT